MVKIDFTDWKSFSSCPAWWRNFVKVSCKGISGLHYDSERRDKALSDALSIYGAKISFSNCLDRDIEYIEFETKEDFLAFSLKWM